MSGEENKIDMDKLAEAFEGEKPKKDSDKEDSKKKDSGKKEKSSKKGRSKKPVVFFAIGMVILAIGLGFLIFKLVTKPNMADAEFLVSTGKWAEEDQPSVIWDFKDVGKGSLTTDNGTNNYDFIWALDGNKIKIETTWLYNLNDEFEYSLDQGGKVLTVKNSDGEEVKFKAVTE